MIALVYLATVAGSILVLAVVLLRSHPAPGSTPPPKAPAPVAALPATGEAEIRLILAAATQLAARLTPAA
ncbi:hypothetical protein ACFWWT_47120 [Streptomyces sp. NPDC058676]|uniref:hypothetical protein n=1 Tax=unclassified Streptomyces TaxID=2593676 RepID=UPI00364A771E